MGLFRWLSIVLALLCTTATASHATARRVIDTGSRDFTIVDDGDRLAAALVDDLPVDTYVYHPGGERKRIAAVTDTGEHMFDFPRGQTIDFQIRFEGRLYPHRFAPVESHVWNGPEAITVPFELGPNNSILIDASINGSRPLRLLFDTGASVSVLNTGAARPDAALSGPTGEIRLGNLRISNTPIIAIDYRDSLKADGVLGYNVFLGRQVVIDYGRRELRIGRPSGPPPSGFRTLPIIWRGGHSLVMVGLDDGAMARQLPMVLDTGSKYAVSLSSRDPLAAETHRLSTYGWRIGSKSDGQRVFSRVFTMPTVTLAGFAMPNVQADVEQRSGASVLDVDILGNDFLKRFDVIMDYESGQVHVRPNSLSALSYNRIWLTDRNLLVGGGLLLLLIVAAVVAYAKRWRKRRSAS